MKTWATIAAICLFTLVCVALYSMLGAGGYKRWTTISGVYPICRPDGFDVVCFMEAKHSGISCLPLAQAGGTCNPKKP